MACDQPLNSVNFAFDECNCVANRDEPLRVAGVNSDAEFLFKRHDDLIEVDAVSPRVSEFGIFGQLRTATGRWNAITFLTSSAISILASLAISITLVLPVFSSGGEH